MQLVRIFKGKVRPHYGGFLLQTLQLNLERDSICYTKGLKSHLQFTLYVQPVYALDGKPPTRVWGGKSVIWCCMRRCLITASLRWGSRSTYVAVHVTTATTLCWRAGTSRVAVLEDTNRSNPMRTGSSKIANAEEYSFEPIISWSISLKRVLDLKKNVLRLGLVMHGWFTLENFDGTLPLILLHSNPQWFSKQVCLREVSR